MAPAVFAAFAALGLYGMAPAVSFGDSGEFIASGAALAIPHAPGYPLFCLLAHALGTLLPWANWGYRVNLLSVLCGAAALAVFWDAARRATSALGATAAAAFLGLTPLWLHTSLQAEVFSLACLCAACALWLVCRYPRDFFDPRPMAALGLCLGLGGANHHTLILVVPAVLLAGWHHSRPGAGRAARGLGWLLAFGLLGLAVYLYLPLRSRANPPLDWGHPVDLARFLHVLLRKDYGSLSLTVGGVEASRWGSLWPQLARYLGSFYSGFGPVGAALCALGLGAWLLGRPEPPALTWKLPALWILVAGPGFLWLGNPPFDAQTSGALERFHLLSWLGAALAVSHGAELVRRSGLGRWSVALAAAPMVSAMLSSPAWCQRWDLAAHDYGANVLRSLPSGSALFMDGGDDTFYTLAYLQFAQRRRPDVEPHDRGGLVFPSAYGPDFRRLDKQAKDERRRSVEASFVRARPTFYSTFNAGLLPGYTLELWGLLRRAVPAAAPAKGSVPASAGDALLEVYPVRTSPAMSAAHYRYRALVPVYSYVAASARAADGASYAPSTAAQTSEISRSGPSRTYDLPKFGTGSGTAPAAQGSIERAFLLLEDALAQGPDVSWVPGSVAHESQWVGYRASLKGDLKLAARAYRLSVRARPGDAGVWANLGAVLEKAGDLAEAEAVYKRVLAATPSGAAYFNLGTLYWKLGRWSEAAAAFDQAGYLDPGSDARTFAAAARARAGAK